MPKHQWIIALAWLQLTACGVQSPINIRQWVTNESAANESAINESPAPVRECGSFDTAQLKQDLENGYFERGGIELAKATIVILAHQRECEKAQPDRPK
jgi:hypothetical protein